MQELSYFGIGLFIFFCGLEVNVATIDGFIFGYCFKCRKEGKVRKKFFRLNPDGIEPEIIERLKICGICENKLGGNNMNAQPKKCRTKVSEVEREGATGATPSPSNVDPHIQKILDLFCK